MIALEDAARTVDVRDPYTFGHCNRVAALAAAVAEKMGFSEQDRLNLQRSARLHDIGKVGVPASILHKSTPLSNDDWNTIRTHPDLGVQMLSGLRFLREALPAIKHHHERFDGSGYPDRLAGEQIPLAARVLAVVDAYDAIVTDRPYRRGRSEAEGMAEIARSAGTQFDPAVVKVLQMVIFGEPSQPVAEAFR